MTTILVVEDEGIIARDLKVTLERMGYDVPEVAATGMDAIDAALRLEPDLVLMDVHLRGDMDGTVAAHRIRKVVDTAVVYLTAYADEETLDRAQEAEPYGYLVKPFDEETLRTTIETALRRRSGDQRRDRTMGVQVAAMDRVREGLLLLDEDGTVEHANQSARIVLDGDPTGSFLHAWRTIQDDDVTGAAAWERLCQSQQPRVWRVGEQTCTVSAQRVGDAYVVVLEAGTDVAGHEKRSKAAVESIKDRARRLI